MTFKSTDTTARLWSISSGKCVHVFANHGNRVMSIACSPDGQKLALASQDEIIRLWDMKTKECLWVVDERIYTQANITGAVGLTVGQRTALRLLGAVDRGMES